MTRATVIRTPDPHNPQPGDRYVWWADHDTYAIAAHDGTEVWMRNGKFGEHITVTVKSLCNPERWTPAQPPLITEDTVLHHYLFTSRSTWGFVHDALFDDITGRRIMLRPDGTWHEVTS